MHRHVDTCTSAHVCIYVCNRVAHRAQQSVIQSVSHHIQSFRLMSGGHVPVPLYVYMLPVSVTPLRGLVYVDGNTRVRASKPATRWAVRFGRLVRRTDPWTAARVCVSV
jgi:hypothetical protein